METPKLNTPDQMAKDAMKSVKHVFLVMSGKGGVGKTTIAVNLAFAFANKGYNVGIMDVDIHGPNVPFMSGTEGIPAQGEEGKIFPVVSPVNNKVKVMSISAFLSNPDDPIIWRGPRKIGAIRQFMGEGDWSNTDILVVDCPPGTGDEPLSVAQLAPTADGVIVVTSPQDVSLLDSRKSVNFAKQLNLPMLGIVENMSGFICPNCGEEINIFKKGGGEKAADQLKVPFLGRIPITPAIVEAGDSGRPIVEDKPEDLASKIFFEIAEKLVPENK